MCILCFASVYALDQFDVQYVTFLLDTIESSAADSSMEDIADGFLNLLLSFNQHFSGKQQLMDISSVKHMYFSAVNRFYQQLSYEQLNGTTKSKSIW